MIFFDIILVVFAPVTLKQIPIHFLDHIEFFQLKKQKLLLVLINFTANITVVKP